MTSRQRWLVFGLAGLAALSGMAMFGYVVWVTMKNVTSPPPPTAEDRRLVITAEALAEFGGPAPNPKAETLTAIRQFDGSRHINYSYDSKLDPDAVTRLNTTSITMVHTSAIGAIQAFKVQEMTTKAGLKLAQGTQGAKLVDTPGLLTIGDAHYAGVFRYKDLSTGHLFVVRQGRFVFTVLIFGLVFDDTKEANALFLPLVEEAKKRS
jgi:hypothetical protein